MKKSSNKYKVTYKDGKNICSEIWYAESATEAKKVARDEYKQTLDEFKGIVSVIPY